MHSLAVFALLLILLATPTAASSPLLVPVLPTAPMEPYYGDPEGLLIGICDLCEMSIEICMHAVTQTHPPQRAPTFEPSTFYGHPEWPHGDDGRSFPLSVQDASTDLALDTPFTLSSDPTSRLPLYGVNLEQLNLDAMTVNPITVSRHVEDTYTPGDRLASRAAPRHQIPRRQAPRPGGYRCTSEGCTKAFDRSCDLNRHQKTHLGRSERPHKCSVCKEGFLYPKDRSRHERTHDSSCSPQATLYCHIPGCSNTDGFSRRDNLLRHQRRQHPS